MAEVDFWPNAGVTTGYTYPNQNKKGITGYAGRVSCYHTGLSLCKQGLQHHDHGHEHGHGYSHGHDHGHSHGGSLHRQRHWLFQKYLGE